MINIFAECLVGLNSFYVRKSCHIGKIACLHDSSHKMFKYIRKQATRRGRLSSLALFSSISADILLVWTRLKRFLFMQSKIGGFPSRKEKQALFLGNLRKRGPRVSFLNITPLKYPLHMTQSTVTLTEFT